MAAIAPKTCGAEAAVKLGTGVGGGCGFGRALVVAFRGLVAGHLVVGEGFEGEEGKKDEGSEDVGEILGGGVVTGCEKEEVGWCCDGPKEDLRAVLVCLTGSVKGCGDLRFARS